ncbi:unannotated protein [freshwater metagenome]|uniref:Unannotated protein n=1 Tax=freshwater metagenome TaxID=449393 RepID=A0A6J6JXG9_9ZZZZ
MYALCATVADGDGVGVGLGVTDGVGVGVGETAAAAPRRTSPGTSRSPTATVIADLARDVIRKLYVPA